METTQSHFLKPFSVGSGVVNEIAFSSMAASGLLGFFYRNLGCGKTGKVFLKTNRI